MFILSVSFTLLATVWLAVEAAKARLGAGRPSRATVQRVQPPERNVRSFLEPIGRAELLQKGSFAAVHMGSKERVTRGASSLRSDGGHGSIVEMPVFQGQR